jgi:hypothetical protein
VLALAHPLDLGLAVDVALGEALAAARGGELVHGARRMAQALVGAALAPVPLAYGVRHGTPAMALRALPFHERQAVDVALGDTPAAVAGGVALDLFERQLAHRLLPPASDSSATPPLVLSANVIAAESFPPAGTQGE